MEESDHGHFGHQATKEVPQLMGWTNTHCVYSVTTKCGEMFVSREFIAEKKEQADFTNDCIPGVLQVRAQFESS